MKVLVVGAGIGGLTTALALHAQGLEVRVVEAVQQLRPLGVGINLLPHAVGVLDTLGLTDALAAMAIPTREVAFYNRHGQWVWSDGRGLEAGYPFPQYSVHRGELQMMLYGAACERLPSGSLQLGRSLRSFSQDASGVQALFEDRGGHRHTETADLLLGVDGIHSAVRRQLYPAEGAPHWSRMILYRGTSITPPFLSGRTMVQMGHANLKFVCYPISRPHHDRGESYTNWIADVRVHDGEALKPEDWNGRADIAQFAHLFKDWRFDWLDVPAIIASAREVFEFPMVDRDPLPQWTLGRATLVGDAAHPMYPIGSNGATQAIMDAQALAQAFRAHGNDWQSALGQYESERRAATTALTLANREEGLDRILDLVDERAPQGFKQVDEAITPAEIQEIVLTYKRLAGHQNIAPGPERAA